MRNEKGQFKKGDTTNKGRVSQFKGRKRPPFSEEWKKNISKSKKGQPSHWKGKKFSEEYRKKLSEAHKGKHHSPLTEFKKGITNTYLYNEKWKQKMNLLRQSKKYKERQSISQRGVKGSNWKGGITSLIKQIRQCFKYRQWRSDIFTRDDYTCQICGIRGTYLEADHFPKLFSTIFHENSIKSLDEALICEEFWNINNGRTLCRSCHDKTKLRK